MFTDLSNTLRKYASGWLVLIFLAGETFFNAVILPGQQAKTQSGSGGVGPIDLQFFYTPEKVYGMVVRHTSCITFTIWIGQSCNEQI